MPSGATSDRLAAKPITAAVEDDVQDRRGAAEDVHVLVERRRACRRARTPRRGAGRPAGRTAGRPTRGRRSRRRWARTRSRRRRSVRRARLPSAPSVAEVQRHARRRRAVASRLGAPLARRLEPVDDRRLAVLHVDHDRRLVHDPGARALAPVVEPAHHLVQVVDARAGDRRRPGRRGSRGRSAPSSARRAPGSRRSGGFG